MNRREATPDGDAKFSFRAQQQKIKSRQKTIAVAVEKDHDERLDTTHQSRKKASRSGNL